MPKEVKMKVTELSSGIEIQDPKIGVFICYDGDGKGNPSVDIYEKDSTGKLIRLYKTIYGSVTELIEYNSQGFSHGVYSWRPDMWFDGEGNSIPQDKYTNDETCFDVWHDAEGNEVTERC